jgi:hypothetical protein
MQKFGIIGFLFENVLHWEFGVRLLPFTVRKGTAIPLQPLTGPEGSWSLIIPDFKTFGT